MDYSSQFSKEYDTQLERIPHYERHPQMMPFVGADYGKLGPKLLLIGESHYLNPKSTIHLDPTVWYQSTVADLDQDSPADNRREYWATHTRACLTKKGPTWKKRSFTIFRNIEAALLEAGYPVADNTLRYVAYMNGFQRPAVSRLSIKETSLDRERAVETVQSVIDVLQPDHVICVSRKAFKTLNGHLDGETYGTPHPASAWWNRASRRGTGKNQFVELVRGFHGTTGEGESRDV